MKLIQIPCTHCASEMVLTKSEPNATIRCSKCGFLTAPLDKKSVEKDRGAWWSLWLGLSSIVLLFLTGIPAVYLGVRSLLRMRHYNPRPGDRRAAIAGTSLGSFFGIIIGSVVGFLLFVVVLTLTTLEQTKDPAEIKQILSNFATIETPDSLLAYRGRVILNSQQEVIFQDHQKQRDATIRLEIGYLKPMFGANTNQLRTSQIGLDFGVDLEPEGTADEKLKWRMCGEDVTVTRTRLVEEKPDTNGVIRKITRYYGMTTNKSGTYGLVVLLREPNNSLSEEDVRKIFESLLPVEH